MRSGAEQFWKGETVALPKYSIGTVQERKFSKPRTILAQRRDPRGAFTVKLVGRGEQQLRPAGNPAAVNPK